MSAAVAVALVVACATGAVLRVLVDVAVRRAVPARGDDGPPTPWGIGVVNLTGALALGLLAGALSTAGSSAGWPQDVVLVLGTGLLGSYTTFSTMVVDALRLAAAGRTGPALVSLVLTVVPGLALAAAGWWAGTLLAG